MNKLVVPRTANNIAVQGGMDAVQRGDKAPLLVVVQNRPTQFDVPFYAAIHRADQLRLVVFYTEIPPNGEGATHRELGLPSQWDNFAGQDYVAYFQPSMLRAWWHIMALRPTHVIICGWYPRAHALLAVLLRASGCRIGVRSDNTLDDANFIGAVGSARRWLLGRWLRIYHTFHPVGELAGVYLKTITHGDKPLVYFPYAIDADWFLHHLQKKQEQRVQWRHDIGLVPEDFVILGVIKWTPREDPLTLLDAASRAMTVIPHLKLVLVGEGPLRPAIEKRCSHLLGRVILPGYVKYTELPHYYGLADLFVHPAVREPYGVSVHEAVACGLPVLVTDAVGSAADFLVPGVNGDRFPVGNVDVLTRLLIEYARRRDGERMRRTSLSMAQRRAYTTTISQWRAYLQPTV